MAGNVENETVLAALNQQIQAINDLITGIAGLVSAIGGLTLECNNSVNCTPTVSPIINVTCGGVTGGSQFTSEPGEEGGEPPEGWQPPSETTVNRKCKSANAVVWTIQDICSRLIANDAQAWAGYGAAIVGGLVGGILGLAASPFGAIVGLVLGVVAGATAALVTGSVQLDDMLDAVNGNLGALVCGLYASLDADEARESFVGTMQAAMVMNATTEAFLRLILPNNLVNLLFFTYSDETESAIDEVEILFDCGECAAATTAWHFTQDVETWALDDQSEAPCVTTGEWTDTVPTDPLDDAGHLRMDQVHAITGFCWARWHVLLVGGPVITADSRVSFDYYLYNPVNTRMRLYVRDSENNEALYEYANADEWTPEVYALGNNEAMRGHQLAEIAFILDQGGYTHDGWLSVDNVAVYEES
jgi:hypothetical protein